MSEEEKQPLMNASAPPADIESKAVPVRRGPAFMGLSATLVIILYYALCSSTMLVINKVAIHHIPAPTFLLCCQLFVSTVVSKVGGMTGAIEVDALEWTKVKRFMWVVVGFLGTIWCNIKVLQNSNVETFITFRSRCVSFHSFHSYRLKPRNIR